MSDPSYQRAQLLFERALAVPPAKRHAFIRRRCVDDPRLLGLVEDLLAQHAAMTTTFLAGDAVQDGTRCEERPGDTIGRYKLLRVVAEGGFGTVYLAQRLAPDGDLVALKIVKLGMDTREVIRRFEAEREFLEMLDHPGIACMLDAGATALGRPYFVMEFVPGDPIDEFCDAARLSIGQRIRLLVTVCDAVSFVHEHGVIHRDLKPSNLLVMRRQGRPHPKVIDFGIARALTGGPETKCRTSPGQVLGTPAYMSPEQSRDPSGDLDARTDVFSLGVVLYQLLVGCLPAPSGGARPDGRPRGRRSRARASTPVAPSARLRGDEREARLAAALRGFEPKGLERRLRGDLDWIALKALAASPDERYASVADLAADLRRHLGDEPVRPAPHGILDRLGDIVRRSRLTA